MSLQSQLASLISAIGADIKALKTQLGENSSLSTTEKASLVGAINELQSEINSISGPTIYVQSTEPSGPHSVGDLWIKTP